MKIRATIKDKLDGQYFSDDISRYIDIFINDDPDIPLQILSTGIFISHDMGWQTRSTGQMYNSLTVHGFMIGFKTGKIVALAVRAKKCAKFSLANKNSVRVIPHTFPVNHGGSSGSMEAKVALDLTSDIHSNSNSSMCCPIVS